MTGTDATGSPRWARRVVVAGLLVVAATRWAPLVDGPAHGRALVLAAVAPVLLWTIADRRGPSGQGRSMLVSLVGLAGLLLLVVVPAVAGAGPAGLASGGVVVTGLVEGPARLLAIRPPLPTGDPALVVGPVVVWLAAWVATEAEARARSRWAPVGPPLVVFVLGVVLVGPAGVAAPGPSSVTVGFAGLAGATGWLGGHRPGAPRPRAGRVRDLLVVGRVVGVAVVVGLPPLAIGALTPVRPAVDLRDRGAGHRLGRIELSPLVMLTRLEASPADRVAFTARPIDAGRPEPIPDRWRLAVLDQFDGQTWRNSAVHEPIGAALTADGTRRGPPRGARIVVTVADLDGPWLPMPDRAARWSGAGGLHARVDRSAGTVLVDRDRLDGLRYEVTLAQRGGGTSAPAGSSALPARGDPAAAPLLAELAVRARRVVGPTPVAMTALARLEAWFRGRFDHDDTAPGGLTTGDLAAFVLEARRGDGAQFAGAFAVLARMLGHPSRLAVGFLGGQPRAGHTVVRAGDAHVWPEVLVAGQGWVAFEPSPGRSPSTTPPLASGAASGPAGDRRLRAAPVPAPRVVREQLAPPRPGPTPVALLGPVLVAATALASVGVARRVAVPPAARWRRRRSRRGGPAPARVVGARLELLDLCARAGIADPGRRTGSALVGAVRARLGADVATATRSVVEVVEAAAFSGRVVGNAQADAAWTGVERLRRSGRGRRWSRRGGGGSPTGPGRVTAARRTPR